MFLTKKDFLRKVNTGILDQITESNDSLIDSAQETAEGIIIDLLSGMYDMAAEFAKAGSARHINLVTWMLNLSAYLLYDRIPDDEVPERVIKDYDDTMATIHKIAAGKMPTTLAPKLLEDGVSSKRAFRMGGNNPRNHKML